MKNEATEKDTKLVTVGSVPSGCEVNIFVAKRLIGTTVFEPVQCWARALRPVCAPSTYVH